MSSFPQSRHRNRIIGVASGVITTSSGDQVQNRYAVQVCDDTIGDKGGNHDLYMYRERLKGGELTDDSGGGAFWFKGVPTNITAGARLSGPSISSYTNRILAQTGPLTPSVYLPVALVELRDLPKMLKQAGDLLHNIATPGKAIGLTSPKAAASATLAAQFGWLPLMQDLSKLMDLSRIIANRQKILQGAHSTKGIRRRITLDSNSISQRGNEIVWSTFGRQPSVAYSGTKSYKTWAVCHWVVRDPAAIGKPPSFGDAFDDALGLGLGNIPVNVWKALPWSWAFDWFGGISDLLNAGRNHIYYRPSNISVMRRSVNSWVYPSKKFPGGYTFSEGVVEGIWKERFANNAPNPNLNVRLPFMDNFKLSILGSFAILKLL